MYCQFNSNWVELLSARKEYVLLETAKWDPANRYTWLFVEPEAVLSLESLEDLPELFDRIERYTALGCYVAGYFHYECGFYFEPKVPRTAVRQPMAWLGVYRNPMIFDHSTGKFRGGDSYGENFTGYTAQPGAYRLKPLGFEYTQQQYCQKIAGIREYIAAGDVYQINFTGKYQFEFEGSTSALYNTLQQKQPVAYSALLNDGKRTVLSFSPELFFRLESDTITAKPMKGTAPRGKNRAEDVQIARWLQQDAKNRAENLMIVDLIRNDLGRMAALGSVQVPELFAVEQYRMLQQMTSTVTGQLKPGLSYFDIFRSLFPYGSITGAPKVRAMQLIGELEQEPRGIYTGAIGYFGPERNSVFNVAIRTLVIEGGRAEMGIGSGVVFDSDPDAEYQECLLKAAFCTEGLPQPQILEAIRWEEGYQWLDRHLERFLASAEYFHYPLDIHWLRRQLEQNQARLVPGRCYKVRLTLDCQGQLTVENQELPADVATPTRLKVMLARQRTDSRDRFLYHKTTRRQQYNEEYQNALRQGLDEVLFINEKGQVTEGAISNVIIEKDGLRYTPPVDCGLLGGICRQVLLEQDSKLQERVLTPADLHTADRIYLCNAIRGLRQVEGIFGE